MSRAISAFIFLISSSAYAQLDGRVLTCFLHYQVETSPGMIKYVQPENGHKTVRLLDAEFCNAHGCTIKRIGSGFLGSAIGGASIRIVGDRTTIVLRDSYRNRASAVLNTSGLVPTDNGPAQFTLNAQGEFKGEPLVGVVFTCGLNP